MWKAPISTSSPRARATMSSGTPAPPTMWLASCSTAATPDSAKPRSALTARPPVSLPSIPRIYTGGIDPYLWRPIPGVHTLNFEPYRVDLTPFAGVLSNGQLHNVAVSVYNADQYFSATATLLLYLDAGS